MARKKCVGSAKGVIMKLPRTSAYLAGLLHYLRGSLFPNKLPRGIKVIHDPRCDRSNKKSARAFCFVEEGSSVIHCAENIEQLPAAVVVGLLLHEVVHTFLRDHPDLEVGNDEFVEEKVPEAGLKYAAAVNYFPTGVGRRTARNIQTVSLDFVATIMED